MAAVVERRQELYGPERNLRVQEIQRTLTKSHVLQDGEYNFTNNKLKNSTWDTTHDINFKGQGLAPCETQGTSSQLVTHFALGNASGQLIKPEVYSKSTTKDDFHAKNVPKPEIKGEVRIINWPDMAPRYSLNRKIGNSEYETSFDQTVRSNIAPLYPRADTSKMQLPLDPKKFWHGRDTSIVFGSDHESNISEAQRMYGRGEMAFQPDVGQEIAAKGINQMMKNMSKVGHVFRTGDYDNIVGSFKTVVNDDYGPRTVAPGDAALQKARAREKRKTEGDEEDKEDDDADEHYANANQLQKYAREVTVPTVFKAASDGRDYQTTAHFQFGTDENKGSSIYSKDYKLSTMVGRQPPVFKATPSAGRLLQFDPNRSQFGRTSTSVDFLYHPSAPHKDAQGKTLFEINLDRRNTDNIILSYDQTRHQGDRQTSICHNDYVPPPHNFKPMEPQKRPPLKYDFLQTNDALGYPGLSNHSEAKHNFTGYFMKGPYAIGRRNFKTSETKGRLDDGRSTHFTVGYERRDYDSETKMKFRGEAKNDQGVAPAGKLEPIHPTKFSHLEISSNQQDLRAADPFITNTRESLPARMNYEPPTFERSNTTSIMKADYKPFGNRKVSSAHARIYDKYDKVLQKNIAQTHFFHTDNSGNLNYQTTASSDYIKPEDMTGRKFLAAR